MADYVDNEVMAGNSLSDIMAGHEGVRVNFCLVVFCFEGQLQVNVNNKTVTLRKDDMLTCVPSTIIGEALLGNTHKVKVFGFSTKFLEVLTAGEQNIDNIIQFMKSNPVRHLSSTQLDPSVLSMYGEIIMRKATERTKRFKEKIMKEIFAAFFCELMAETTEHIDETEVEDNEATRAHFVYKNFMKALAGDDGTHRSVN